MNILDSLYTISKKKEIYKKIQTIRRVPPRKTWSAIQPSLQYNKVKLPEYLVSEGIIRNTGVGKKEGRDGQREEDATATGIAQSILFLNKISHHANINN